MLGLHGNHLLEDGVKQGPLEQTSGFDTDIAAVMPIDGYNTGNVGVAVVVHGVPLLENDVGVPTLTYFYM